MDMISLLAQAAQQTVEKAETVGSLPAWYLEAILGLSLLAAGFAFMVFRRQKQIAKNQVDIAKMVDELLNKK